MRVLMLTDYFAPHSGGGVERVVLELSRALTGLGLEVAVVTLAAPGAPRAEILAGVRVERVGALSLTPVLGLQSAFAPRLYGRALTFCARFRPDIIHAHNIFFVASAVAPWLKMRLGVPLVTTMHLGSLERLDGLHRWAARLYEVSVGRWILRHSDLVVAVGDAVRDHARSLGVTPDRLITIPNSVAAPPARVPPAGVSPTGYPLTPPRVVFVGRLIVNKGPHLLVNAAGDVLQKDPRVEFHFVGDGPLRNRLEAEVARRGYGRQFRFWGLRDDVPDILSSATLFVRPSLLEGMPLAVLEAMVCGVPVIATRVGGTAELIQDGETGWLVEPGDARGLATAILALLRDPPQRRRLAANARNRAERHIGWDAAAAHLRAEYARLLGNPPPARRPA